MSVFDAGRMCVGSKLEEREQELGLPSTPMKTKRVGECLLAAQGARGVLPALRTLRPVMPAQPDVAGSASEILWVRFQTDVRLGSAKAHAHSVDTRLAV